MSVCVGVGGGDRVGRGLPDSLPIHIYIHGMRHGVESIHNHTQL